MAWMEVKRLKANYFDVIRTSLDGSVTILGESYTTSSFAMAASGTSLPLPADVAEMKLIECITSGYEGVSFTFRDLTHPSFVALRQLTETQEPAAFLVDLVGELTLVFAPKPNRALDLRLTYLPILDNLTTGTDTVQMPHPLWLGVLDIATQRAMTMDENPSLALWQQSARQTIASFISSHARQVQDPQFVTSPFE